MPAAVVYVVESDVDARAYVGKSINPRARWISHKRVAGYGPKSKAFCFVHAAIRKYGIDRFRMCVVEECESEDAAYDAEVRWISALKSDRPEFGFNLLSGGSSGYSPQPATREKIAAKLRGVKHTPERIAKSSASHKGKTITAEHRAKVGAAQRGRKRSDETRKRMSVAMTGKTLSPEARSKIAASLTGRTQSAETRAKHSVSSKGRRHTPESRAKMSAVQKEIAATRPNPRIGQKRTSEQRARMSAGMKGVPHGPMSAEHKAKISAANSHPKTPETRARMRDAQLARWAAKRAAREAAKQAPPSTNE